MEKTISINLSGQSFEIEEDAFKKLSEYLESIKRHCGVGADAAEVISDIETSLAEKLKLSLNQYKEIITSDDIDSLIKIMGTVEDFDREVGGTEAGDQNDDKEDNGVKRKLYRDTDNAIIGGVASGLGKYFDTDPVLFRAIFCALVFAGGSGIPIYILLWIIMPEAKTSYQKLEMQGQAPTLAAFKNLARAGKKMKEDWKTQWKKSSTAKKLIDLPIIIIRELFSVLEKIWNVLWPAARIAIGLIITTLSFIALGAFGIFSLMLILYRDSSYQISFIPISELAASIPYIWIISAGFLSLALPAFLILLGGISITAKKNLINPAVASIFIGLWLVAGVFFCAFSLRYLPEIKLKFDNFAPIRQEEKAIDLTGITQIEADGARLNILIESDTSTPANLKGRAIDIKNIEIIKENNRLMLKDGQIEYNGEICLNCQLRSVYLTIPSSTEREIEASNGATIDFLP